MLAECTFYRLMFGREANIRFSLNNLVNKGLYEGTPYKVTDVNIPDAHLNLSTITLTVPGEASFEYQYVWIQTGTQGQANYKTSTWWVEDITQVANSTPLIRVTLARDPWYDVLNFKRTIKGRFSALPTHKAPYLPLTIAQDTLVGGSNRIIDLPTIKKEGNGSKYGFVVITTSKLLIGANQGKDGIYQYGAIVRMEKTTLTAYVKVNLDSEEGIVTMPSSSELINNPVKFLQGFYSNIAEKDIVDISISERCPFTPTITQDDYYGDVFAFYSSTTPSRDHLWSPKYYIRNEPTGGTTKYGLYDLGVVEGLENIEEITLGKTGISNDLIRATGQLHLKDAMDNLIAVIPSNLVGLKFKVRTIIDYTGMTTYVWNDELQTVYKIPEGHIPFNGSSWLEYMAKNREYDRECMQINIDKANADAAVNAASGIASGALTGALTANPVIGVATAALNIGTTIIGRKVSIDSEKALQDAREQSYKIASNNTYNLGYGLAYMQLSALRVAHIDIMLPYSVGSAEALQKYVKYNGYPAVGEFEVKMDTAGFYQGYAVSIYTVSGTSEYPTITYQTYNKTLNDLLNDELIKGIRIIKDKGDI